MSNAARPMTRSQLYGLGAMALALAVLAFFLGIEVGRRVGPTAAPAVAQGLVPEAVRDGQMEELLAKVESVQGQPLTFPAALPAARPSVSPDGVPSAGWAVEVALFPTVEEAQAKVGELRAAQLAAYRVEALVDGRAQHHVRVGGYASKDAAAAAIPDLRQKAGTDAAVVVPAP